MVNPQDAKAFAEETRRTNELRQAYAEFVGSFVYKDLMEYLSTTRDTSQNVAGGEMDNMDKKALYLQDAYAYGKVITYISDMADVAQQ